MSEELKKCPFCGSEATIWHNGLGLCFDCHREAHDKPELFERWLLSNIKHYGVLIDKRATVVYSLTELQEIKEKLKFFIKST